MKKTLLTAAVAAASFVGLTAFAGGGAVMPAQHNTFAYVELNTGFANKHLEQVQNMWRIHANNFTHARTNAVWTIGGDVGYQLMNHLAIELGGNWMQGAEVTGPFNAREANDTKQLNEWVAYLAGKMGVQVYNHLSVFAKAGLGYQRQSGSLFDFHAHDALALQNSTWVPVFAVGANYDVNHNVFAGLQYMRFGSQNRSTDTRNWSFTAKDLVTASLGYKFQM